MCLAVMALSHIATKAVANCYILPSGRANKLYRSKCQVQARRNIRVRITGGVIRIQITGAAIDAVIRITADQTDTKEAA